MHTIINYEACYEQRQKRFMHTSRFSMGYRFYHFILDFDMGPNNNGYVYVTDEFCSYQRSRAHNRAHPATEARPLHNVAQWRWFRRLSAAAASERGQKLQYPARDTHRINQIQRGAKHCVRRHAIIALNIPSRGRTVSRVYGCRDVRLDALHER